MNRRILPDRISVLPEPQGPVASRYPRMTIDYAWSKMREHQYELSLERARTPLRQWQAGVRESFVKALGELPERRGAPRVQSHGRLQRDGYVVEKLSYETFPGLWATCLLYLPDPVERPVPAILHPLGHYELGRFEPEVQTACITVARQGYACLMVDMTGLGDFGHLQHSSDFLELYYVGMSPPGIEIYIHLRALDLLDSRDDITRPYGITGCSGGGWRTFVVSILDPRIDAAVSVGMGHTFEENYITSEDGCPCEYPFGLARWASYDDLIGLIAPRPLLIISGIFDEILPSRAARDLVYKLRKVYTELGAGDNLEHLEAYSTHANDHEAREAMYRFFDRHLRGVVDDRLREEYPVVVEEAEPSARSALSTWPKPPCTTWGSIYYTRWRQRRPPDVPGDRAGMSDCVRAMRQKIASLLGGFPERSALRIADLSSATFESIQLEMCTVYPEPEIMLPTYLISPVGERRKEPLIVLVSPDGEASSLKSRDTRLLVDNGYRVFAPDLRGQGEVPRYEHENLTTWDTSFINGSPVIGQRVYDIMRLLDYLRQEKSTGKFVVWGKGPMGLTALLAALMDERVRGLILDRSPLTLVTDKDLCILKRGFLKPEDVIPNLIEAGDIPEILGAVSNLTDVFVCNPLDAAGEPIETDDERLAWAMKANEISGGRMRIVRASGDEFHRELLSWLSQSAP